MRRLWQPALFLSLTLLLLATTPLAARSKGAPTAPGHYTDWNGEIDDLEIVQPFRLADYTAIAVAPFDASKVELPDADDNTYLPVKTVAGDVALPLASGLRDSLGRVEVAVLGKGQKPPARSLELRGEALLLDPGSKAARYWAGFGAGAAKVRLRGEVVDTDTGKVLFKFEQERRSGVGALGGDYVELLQRNLVQIGEDLATVFEKMGPAR